MSPPSKKKRKKNTSKAIPNLEAALKAIGTVATKIESTHQSKADIAKELTTRNQRVRYRSSKTTQDREIS